MPAIGQRQRVGTGIGIRQFGGRWRSPALTAILGPGFKYFAVARPAHGLKFAVFVDENAGLNRAQILAFVDRFGGRPSLTAIGAALEVNAPTIVFGAGPRENVAIRQLHGFILDRPDDTVGQAVGVRPGFAEIVGSLEHAPPFARIGADFVEEEQRAVFRTEQHWVPARQAVLSRLLAGRRFNWLRPLSVEMARKPNADARILFVLSAEPCGDEPRFRFDKGRSVTTGERRFLEDEFLGYDPGVRGTSRRERDTHCSHYKPDANHECSFEARFKSIRHSQR